MTDRLDRQAGRAEGERRRDDALSLLTARRGWLIRGACRALLTHLLDHGTGTADDVADRLPADPDGIDPRWRGAVMRTLSAARLIRRVGYTTSCRPVRHASVIAVWELVDRAAAVAWLSRNPNPPEPGDDAGTACPTPPLSTALLAPTHI